MKVSYCISNLFRTVCAVDKVAINLGAGFLISLQNYLWSCLRLSLGSALSLLSRSDHLRNRLHQSWPLSRLLTLQTPFYTRDGRVSQTLKEKYASRKVAHKQGYVKTEGHTTGLNVQK
jgi:hypothetical protein